MDRSAYLERIQYKGSLENTIDVLRGLQHAHLLSVPFENLDIHLGRPIDLKHTFEKVVRNNRGGFCYELNGLFHDLLQDLGFSVRLISAKVYNGDTKEYGHEFDHMAILVSIDSAPYLVDVGFGEFTFAPLKFELQTQQHDQRGIFSFNRDEDNRYIVQQHKEDVVVPVYSFADTERKKTDFLEMCRYHQTSPDSHFTQKRLCSLPTEAGRISLSGNTLKITEGTNINTRELKNEEEVNAVLKEYFGIVI